MESHKIIQVDEKVPFNLLIPLSIQHMFAMFGASVLVPFLFGINPAIVLHEWRWHPHVYLYHKGKSSRLSRFQLRVSRSCRHRDRKIRL